MSCTKLIIFLFPLFLMFSCGEKRANTKTQFITLGAIAAFDQYPGGIVLKAESQSGLPDTFTRLGPDMSVLLPNGSWIFHLVTFDINGDAKCGSSSLSQLDGNSVSVALTINDSNCSSAFFVTLLAEIETTFSLPSGGGPANSFVTTWTVAAGDVFSFPLEPGKTYNYTIDWGDGSPIATITSYSDPDNSHTYASAAPFTITITGTVEKLSFASFSHKLKLTSVVDLGDMGWISFAYMFEGCSNLASVSGGVTDLVTDMSFMFKGATNLGSVDTISWNTSNVTDMTAMFWSAITANPDVSSWDTSSVTSMNSMFRQASAANPDTSSWNTSSVTNMQLMFQYASSANPDVSAWNVSGVTNFSNMFQFTPIANPNVSNWNVNNGLNFNYMFSNATAASPDFSNWNLASATAMTGMLDNSAATPNQLEDLIRRLANTNTFSGGASLGAVGRQYSSILVSTELVDLAARNWTLIGASDLTP